MGEERRLKHDRADAGRTPPALVLVLVLLLVVVVLLLTMFNFQAAEKAAAPKVAAEKKKAEEKAVAKKKAAAEKAAAKAEKAAAAAAGLSLEIYRLAVQLIEAARQGNTEAVTLLVGKDSRILNYQDEVRLWPAGASLPPAASCRHRCC